MKTKHLALALAAALACPTLVHAQQAEGARATATDDTPESDARRVETPDPQLPTVTVVGVRVIPLPRADAVRADAALAAGAAASSDTVRSPFTASNATRALKPESWSLHFDMFCSPHSWRPADFRS